MTTDTHQELVLIEPDERFPDLFIALDYLLYKEAEEDVEDGKFRLTMEQITDALHNKWPSMPITRQGLYLRIEKWRQDGTLEFAEKIIFGPKIEETRAAVSRVIDAWPEILDNLINRARNPKTSAYATLQIAQFLQEKVIEPALADQLKPSSEEMNYLKDHRGFKPLDVAK